MGVDISSGERDWVSRLSLQSFRNYAHESIEPGPGINLIAGQNAQGKTNLLESLYLISTGRLLRGYRDAMGVKHGDEESRITAILSPSQSEVEVLLRTRGRKTIRWNGNAIRKSSDLLGRLPCVSFSATDLSIARGEPSDRRMFIDTEVGQVLPNYVKVLEIYKKALQQRNAMLRQARENPVDYNLFESYELQMAEAGERIRKYRQDWLEALRVPLDWAMEKVGDGDKVEALYEPADSAFTSAELLDSFANSRSADIGRGSTSIGPHRDDLRLNIETRDVRYFGSQGQQRSAVLALKVAVMKHAMSVFGFAPILLLDDVFSDLDANRRSGVIKLALDAGGQVFITCTDAAQVGDDLRAEATEFSVRSGEVTKQ